MSWQGAELGDTWGNREALSGFNFCRRTSGYYWRRRSTLAAGSVRPVLRLRRALLHVAPGNVYLNGASMAVAVAVWLVEWSVWVPTLQRRTDRMNFPK